MSKIVASAAIRGAGKIVKEAEEFLNRAIKEKGDNQRVEFPDTAFFLPMAYALLGLEVKTLGEMKPVLKEAKSLLRNEPSNELWLPYLGDALDSGISTLLGEELIVALRYLYGQEPQPDCNGFFSDTILRTLGIQLVDGRMPGFAAILGAAPDNKTAVEIVRELQKRSIMIFVGSSDNNGRSIIDQLKEEKVEMGWDTYIVPYGRDTITGIYPLHWAIRGALTFGGHKKGEALKCLKYCKERVFAFGLALGKVDDLKYATGAGAINMGFPVIADTDIPEIRPTGICTYEHLVKEFDHKKIVPTCIEVRGVKVKVSEIPIPVSYSPAFEGERVRREQMHVQFGGKYSTAFEYVTSTAADGIEDGKIEVIGPEIDDMKEAEAYPLGIFVEVAGRKMQKDFEPILERQIHSFLNEAMGVFHMGQRNMCWIRISKEANKKAFKIKHFGVILHARMHEVFGAIVDKCQVKLYTKQEDVEKYLEEAKKIYEERDSRLAGMTDESVDTLYSCTLCVPKHQDIILPDGSFKRIEDLVRTVAEEKDLNVMSFENHSVNSRSVGELFLNPAPRYIQRIFLNNGNQLELTANHKILVDRKDGLRWIQARDILKMDRVVVPKFTGLDAKRQNQQRPLIIDFLPDDIKVFDDNFLGSCLKKAMLKKYGSFAVASKELKIKRGRLYSALYFKKPVGRRLANPRFSLGEIKEICRNLGLEWSKIKREIRKFGVSCGQGYTIKKAVLDKDVMYLAGLVASDGCVKYRGKGCSVQFTNSEDALIQRFSRIVVSMFGIPPKKFIAKPIVSKSGKIQIKSKKPVTILQVNNTILGRLMRGLGIGLQREEQVKWLGHQISTLPNDLIRTFLRGLFDGDGHVTGSHLLISTGPYKEAQHIYLLLKKLGIDSYITKITRGYQVGTRNFSDYIRFRKVISSNHPRKREAMEGARFSFDDNHVVHSDTVPFVCGESIENLLLKYKGRIRPCKLRIDYKTVEAWRKKKCRASKAKLRLFLEEIKDKVGLLDPDYQRLEEWTRSNVNFEKVRDSKLVRYREKEVYNFSVDQLHNYLVNSVVVKNCQSFAPNHVCIVKPERLGLCGAYTWLDAKASFELNPTGPNQPIKKGESLDTVRGEWKGVNELIHQKSNKILERFHGYSIMTFPETSCCIGDTEVVIDGNLRKISEFIDKNLGTEAYAKSSCLTLGNSKAVSEKLIAIQRFPAPERLFSLKTKSGKKLVLTPNHEVAVDRAQGLAWIRADEIQPGDRAISLKKLPLETNLENVIDMVPNDFRVPDPKLSKSLKQSLSEKYGSLARAYRALRLKPLAPYTKAMPLGYLKTIFSALGESWDGVKNSIRKVNMAGSVIEVPAKIDEDMCYLMGLVASDGSISRWGRYQYWIDFVNTEPALIDVFRRLYKKIFPNRKISLKVKKDYFGDIKGRKITPTKKCFQLHAVNPLFGVILDYYGLKVGKNGKWDLRRLIFLPQDLLGAFLAGLFDGDGSVRVRKYGGSWDIGEGYLCIEDEGAASHLQMMLKRFGIVANRRKSTSVYKLELHGSNLMRFAEVIPSMHPAKRAVLERIKELNRHPDRLDKTQERVLPFFVGKALTEEPEAQRILSPSTYFYYKTARSRPVIDNVKKVVELLPKNRAERFDSLLDNDYFLDKICEVKEIKNNKRFEHVYNLTLAENHTYLANDILIKNCGCFECIIAILPEVNGFMVVNREFSGMTPCGMKFTTLAGSVGGGAQTPGFMGIGRLYLVSKKFISADGGIKRIVWMTKELKEALGDKLVKRCEEEGGPDFFNKIADESTATTMEELQPFLEKVKHPALEMPPLM